MKSVLLLLVLTFSTAVYAQPTISFTFDDGSTSNRAGIELEEWNMMLLKALEDAEINAVFFVSTRGKTTPKGRYVLKSWDEKGHLIANHTNAHPNFNNPDHTVELFQTELLKADAIIRSYDNYTRFFRFPYLKEGNTASKVDSIRQILKDNGYRNGHVTVDASDWYIDSRLIKRLRENPDADIEGFKAFYLEHIFERAQYYEKLSYELNGRHIKHNLLLHHNLAAALFLDDLIAMFKSKGWNVISAEEAYTDPIYQTVTRHAGESLIWAMAKDSGKFEHILRYPAEDSRYEKERMDKLGL